MNHQLAIVAHTTRAAQARQLMQYVGAAYLSMDDGTLGCNGNHIHTWRWMAQHNTQPWSVVLEDDALPCEGFPQQLTAALDTAPTSIVGLYLGTGHPRYAQPRIKQGIDQAAQHNAAWLTYSTVLNAVGLAIKTTHIADMVETVGQTKWPIDKAISDWAHTRHIDVAYTHPSLVDHRDQHTTVSGRTRISRPRTAWTHGAREAWNTQTVSM